MSTVRELNARFTPALANGLAVRRFEFEILVIPPQYEVVLIGAKVRRERVAAYGYTLKDAKRRCGIE